MNRRLSTVCVPHARGGGPVALGTSAPSASPVTGTNVTNARWRASVNPRNRWGVIHLDQPAQIGFAFDLRHAAHRRGRRGRPVATADTAERRADATAAPRRAIFDQALFLPNRRQPSLTTSTTVRAPASTIEVRDQIVERVEAGPFPAPGLHLLRNFRPALAASRSTSRRGPPSDRA
jgi:hypothetical protein